MRSLSPSHPLLARILIATQNEGKYREIALLMEGLPIRPVSPTESAVQWEAQERGLVGESVARDKALKASLATALTSLAEDVSLEVDALGGAPGPRAKRFFGEDLDDRERCLRLLSALNGIPLSQRRCRFVCYMAVAFPWGEVILAVGILRGFVALQPKGQFGFGYDPIFYIPEIGKTLAELRIEEKNQISHRQKAFEGLKGALLTRLSLRREGM